MEISNTKLLGCCEDFVLLLELICYHIEQGSHFYHLAQLCGYEQEQCGVQRDMTDSATCSEADSPKTPPYP